MTASTLGGGEGALDRIRILHVDDEPGFADMVAEFLEREDDRFSVETATTTEAGLAQFAAESFDCVVSDYDLPDRNGVELLRTVRELDPDLPFVLFTGKGSEEVASEAISAGVTDYFQKVRGSDQYTLLANKIRNAVEHSRAERVRDRHLEAIETSQEGISILDGDGEYIYVNQSYADLYGYEPAELLGAHWRVTYPDEETDFVREEVLTAVEEEGYWHGETTGLRADGTTFPEGHALSRTAHGDLVCTVRDLSDTHERKAELEQTNALLSTLFETVPVGILAEDESREVLASNEQLGELFGQPGTSDELVGADCRRLAESVSEQFARPEQFVDRIEELVADGTQASEEVELRDGRTLARTYKPIELPDGEGHLWMYHDVTERRVREDRLRETTSRLEALFENSPDMIDVLDPDGSLLDVNCRFCEELGYERDEVLGRPIWEIDQTVDERDVRELLSGISRGDRRKFEGRYERRDGSTFPIEVHLLRLDIVGEDRFLAISRDITDRKAYEDRLERQNEHLDEFASVVSHDLRNPLNIAMGRLELAREECDCDSLDAVAHAHERMNTLIDDLLALAREGDDVSDTEPVGLAALVEHCWRNVATADATVVTETGRAIRADRSRLQQLLENLMRNAVEHGGDDVTVTVGDVDGGFYVADDGAGIPPEERDDVFGVGYSRAPDGTGLGLSIVKRVADAHGWDVRVTEGVDGGARFEFTGVEFEE